ncbi:MAG: DUF1987 domain-containing protein [Magnetococcales bacterium]|nr:DUF1987 domain-containing protein [Magnetococcales bacterium]
MSTLKIAATERSPHVDFDFAANRFHLRGESYPEDVPAFYGPVLERLTNHLKGLEGGRVEFDFELIYFNSSSAKVIMRLFDLLDQTAENGVKVVVNWLYDPEDDNMEELGGEFGEELRNAEFHLKPTAT